jgi:hypothetical protein
MNFEAAQAVDSTKEFVLHWGAFEEGTTNDFTFVLIRRAQDGKPVTNTLFIAEENSSQSKLLK